jgi:hypothetical protein
MKDRRMKEQQMSAPDYNIRVKTQSNEPEAQIRRPAMMYSPLEVNRQNSQCENGQIMASARDGTPITAQKCAEDKSPISEFDPIG